jgi:hypothetical protein
LGRHLSSKPFQGSVNALFPILIFGEQDVSSVIAQRISSRRDSSKDHPAAARQS